VTSAGPTFPSSLLREDLRGFAGYSSARTSHHGAPARLWLNANEAASANSADPAGLTRRYPSPQPAELVTALAGLYDTDPTGLVVGRGSDEAIDLLVRSLCPPGGGGVVITSPTFGMYAVSARLHGVPVHDVPQSDDGTTWHTDVDRVAEVARDTGSRLVFVASPGNPTGAAVDPGRLLALTRALADQAVVVVDEAYQEFAGRASLVPAVAAHPTLAVLRTLSKAHGLAGARVGSVVADPDLAAVLRRVQAPYPLATPVVTLALAALTPEARAATRARVAATVAERPRLAALLSAHPLVRAVYDSEANFVLARCTDGAAVDRVLAELAGHGIVVRDMRHLPGLHDALRVTVGTAADLDDVAAALATRPVPTTTDPMRTR
jgi:histidinol-phosphate aminotransferase